MTRRLTLLLLTVALLTAATVAPSGAQPPSPGHVPSPPLGRVVATFNHGGNPALGQVVCSAQGERVDTNGDHIADALRGRVACSETNGVTRLRIADVALEAFVSGVWRIVARDDNDLVVSADPASAVWYTPVPGICPGSTVLRTYRVIGAAGIRWSDGQATNVTVTSNQFTARATVNTGVCD
jgi:hypothetical protein